MSVISSVRHTKHTDAATKCTYLVKSHRSKNILKRLTLLVCNATFEIVFIQQQFSDRKTVYEHSDAISLKTVCNRDRELHCLL